MRDYHCPICPLKCRSWRERARHLDLEHGWCGSSVRKLNEVDYGLGRRMTQDAAERALNYEYPR